MINVTAEMFAQFAPRVLIASILGCMVGCSGRDIETLVTLPSDVAIQPSSSFINVTSSSSNQGSGERSSSSAAFQGASSLFGSPHSESAQYSSASSNATNSEAAESSSVPQSGSLPETPSRITLEHTIATQWHRQFRGFTIDDFAANTETGVGYAIDKNTALLFELDLLNGEISRTAGIPAEPIALAYLQSESMIAIVSSSPRLVILNTADFSLIDTVPFNLPPTQVAMSKAGVIVVSFANNDESLFLYDMASGKTLASPYAPVDSQFSFVGETLVVTSASYPSALWRYQIADGMVDDLGAVDYGDIELGAIIGNAENSALIATDKGHLLDKNTFSLVDSVNYGQNQFKRIEYLSDGDYALSVDDQNYIRLFDARTYPFYYDVQNDWRRIGANNSLQSRFVEELAVYRGSALAIYKEYSADNNPKYFITQLVLPPYLTDEPFLAPVITSTSSAASSIVGDSSDAATSSGGPSTHSSAASEVSSSADASPYVSTVLKITDVEFDPQDIRVDSDAGVIYVPDATVSTESDSAVYGVTIVDLASGQRLGAIPVQSRVPASDWAANEDLTEFWFNTSVGDNASTFTCLNQQDNCPYYFRAYNAISDMFVAGDFVFALGAGKSGLYQYNKITGELVAMIDTGVLTDWLVLPKRKLVYTFNGDQVKQYSFSAALYETDLSIPAFSPGFVNPDETVLYTTWDGALGLNDFSTIGGLDIKADTRRTFVDIAFGDQRNFTLEAYSGGVGDAFISELKDHAVTPLDIQGQRIFQTAAGVHVYAYKDGTHKLYTVEGAPSLAGKEGINDTDLTSVDVLGGIYRGKRLLWNFDAHESYWNELKLHLTVTDIRNQNAGAFLTIEPFCIQMGCAAGSFTVPIPLSGEDVTIDLPLANYWRVTDFRALKGVDIHVDIRVGGSNAQFSLKDVSISNF